MQFKKPSILKTLHLLLTSLLLGITSTAMAGVHAYAEFKPVLAHETRVILKKYGLPVADNREDPWFRISGTPGFYKIKLHQAREIPQQAVLDIVKMCMNFYEQRGRKEEFQIVMYEESHLEWRNSLSFGVATWTDMKPFFELKIGEKK